MNQFITINDRKMEVVQKGGNGVPIFILPGMGCSFEEWFEVTEALSKTNKIIMFHRPGSGKSEIGEEKRTTTANAEEMKQLMEKLEIVDPVILIGHSYGGLCAQHFSKLYPEKVKALLLIDSTSEDLERLDELELPVLRGNSADNKWLEDFQNYASMNEEETRKIIHPKLAENQKKLPSHIQRQLIQFRQKPNLYKAMISEFVNFKIDAKMIKKLGMLSNIPLVAIGRDKNYVIQEGVSRGLPESELLMLENMWQQLILEQGKLSKRSTVKFAKSAGHSIHLDRPDLVISTLKELTED
ncbi:alpha/beta hydrolase [Planococcus sp. SE5232]|uniref:alpha/beta hydrolase n=1 Tax=unclassified Planococcus (in: firmicutes) TaxID=2662419 RepID=UPI001CBC44F2|nr:alpha/beta hydrolase [Planococcus sp. 4-30]